MVDGKDVNQHGVSNRDYIDTLVAGVYRQLRGLRDYVDTRFNAVNDTVGATRKEQLLKNTELNDVRHRFLDRNEAEAKFDAVNRTLIGLLLLVVAALAAGLVNLVVLLG